MIRLTKLTVFALLLLTLPQPATAFQSGKFRYDDPLRDDPYQLSIPQPTERPLSKTIDLIQKTFTRSLSGIRGLQPRINNLQTRDGS